MQTIQLELPLKYTAKRIFPILDNVVRCPYELIDQIVYTTKEQSVRKLFYLILAKDHLHDQAGRDYLIPYTSLYASGNNAKLRGATMEKVVRKEFVEKSFKVTPQFAHQFLRMRDSNEAVFISPFEAVGFSKTFFEVRLSLSFKTYLHVLRMKQYAAMVPFAKGDLKLLMELRIKATDRLYWLIRKYQWNRGQVVYKLEDLKGVMGVVGMTNRNFFRLLASVKNELEDTWSEFDFDRVKKGKDIVSVLIKFNSDNLQREKNRLDIRFEYEELLLKSGIDIDVIYNIRSLIYHRTTIEKDGMQYFWCDVYVVETIKMATREYRTRLEQNEIKTKKEVDNFTGYLIRALFEGWWADRIENMKNEHSQDLFGVRTDGGISVTAKAIPLEEIEQIVRESGRSLEEYRNMLIRQGKIYFEYADGDGKMYWVPEDHIKRLKVLETKTAYGGVMNQK